jgi:hypothetical protein
LYRDRSVAGFKEDPSVFVVGASHAKDTTPPTVTVSVAVSETLPDVAVIVVEPAATEVAKPLEPAALLMAATAASDELQVTVIVRSCVVLSENVPVATNCWFVPLRMLGLVGVIAMDTSVAEVTVTIVDPDMLPKFAVIFALPERVAFVRPALRSMLELSAVDAENPENCATSVLDATFKASTADEVQVTVDVRSCVVLSEYVPVAVNCISVSTAIVGLVGVNEMDSSWAPLLLVDASRLAVPPPLPQPNKLVTISDVKRMKHAFLLTIWCSSSDRAIHKCR